mmetsp:Transcript_19779/g.47196  ORF Transcript_19779/g.47196 Transcript_19779/m.47196 type:complete len:177 (+) Transcript_19779:105-635(+)
MPTWNLTAGACLLPLFTPGRQGLGSAGAKSSRPRAAFPTHRLRPARGPRPLLAASSGKQNGGGSGGDEDDSDLLPIERQMASRRPKKKVKVIAPAVEEAQGKRPASPTSEFEGKVLSVLSIYGILVLVLGVVLAGSGFLPEEADSFIMDALYPAYTPFVGGFLACSTAYGVWKSRQ